MSFSNIGAKQREKEEKALRYFLAFSLIGSVALHIVVLSLSSLWVKTPEPTEEPIRVIVVDTPKLQAAKPKGRVVAIGGGLRTCFKRGVKPSTNPPSRQQIPSTHGLTPLFKHPLRSETKSQGSSKAAGGSREGRTASIPSQLPSQPKAAATVSQRQDAIANIAQLQPKPVKKTITRAPVANLKPKPAQTRPPVATLRPKRTATLPEKPVSQPKPVIIPSPSPIATPRTQPTVQPTQVPALASSPDAKLSPTQPLPAQQPGQSDNSREVGKRPSVAAASGNRDSGSTRESDNRGSSTDSGNGTGNATAVAAGSRSGNGNGFSTGSGSGTVACRSCPIPEYPSGAENLEGRAVVVIDVDRDGNVNDVQISQSTGHDILDQAVLETVKKKWKFTSSENGKRVRAAVNFATQGSDFYRQAREREHQAREEQQRKKRSYRKNREV